MGDYGYREFESPHVGLVWWAQIDKDSDYVDAANEFWGLAFGVLADGRPSATLIGPSLAPRELHLVAGERGWGVELAAHVFVRQLDKRRLLGEMRDLPTDGRWFELAGVRLPVPEVDGLETLVETLFRQGILAADEGVAAALRGQPVPQSPRSRHRQVVGATGLGPNKHEQLQRARRAYALLQDGWSLASAAVEAGFAMLAVELQQQRETQRRRPTPAAQQRAVLVQQSPELDQLVSVVFRHLHSNPSSAPRLGRPRPTRPDCGW